MKSITIKFAGLCLVAMFAVSMVASATASAAGPVWEHCGEAFGTERGKEPPTKYEDDKCTKRKSTGEWQWEELKATEHVMSEATTLRLRDTSFLALKVEVECRVNEGGSVGPGKKGRIDGVEFASCKNIENCSGTIAAEARNLQWNTELTEESGKVRDLLRGGRGAPGWKVSCGGISDECTSETLDTFVENVPSSGTVKTVFKKGESGKANCSEKKETGEVEGTVILKPESVGIRRATEAIRVS